MSFLLDTNVVSEWVKPHPNKSVVDWLSKIDENRVFISVITLVELRYGIECMPAGARRHQLDVWVANKLTARFEGRILGIDTNIADSWGRSMAHIKSTGRSVELMDTAIAAIAKFHGLTLVTRNVADFESLGIKLLNPWKN